MESEALADDWGDDADPSAKKAPAAAANDEDWDSADAAPADDWDGEENKDSSTAKPTAVAKQQEAPSLERQNSYVLFDLTKLAERQDKMVKQIAELLFVTPTEAACLLRHYGWKAAKVEADWFADSTKVRKEAGISEAVKETGPKKKEVQCMSAFCDVVPIEKAHSLNCGHWFCDECWKSYVTSQINHGRSCIFTTCMGMKCKLTHAHKFGCACKEIVPEVVVRKYVTDKDLLEKYNRWLLSSFVEGQKGIKWCINPKCGMAVEYRTGGTKTIVCKCGSQFCFSCNQIAHQPAPCDLVRKWLEKEKSDDATEIWMAARTKQCPKCSVRIEKNKACNHMSCAKCGHQFCWLCKGPWDKHGSQTGGYYVCNKYNEDNAKGTVADEEKNMMNSQKLLQKYEYYYKRFKSSTDAIKFTNNIHQRIEKATQNLDIAKYSFLTEAVEKLIDARHVLQWTYSLAYYLKAGGKKALFEYQQEMLVGNTEALQDIMENNDIDKLMVLRNDVINRTRTMDKFRAEMVAQVERGDFEELLMSKADAVLTGGAWTCVVCKVDNKKDADVCAGCTACVKHGEQECKACAKKAK
jgi:ariadne-1